MAALTRKTDEFQPNKHSGVQEINQVTGCSKITMDPNTLNYSGTRDEDFILRETADVPPSLPSSPNEEVVPKEEYFSDYDIEAEEISEERTYRNILSYSPDISPDYSMERSPNYSPSYSLDISPDYSMERSNYSPVIERTTIIQKLGLRRALSAPNLSSPEAL